MAWRVAWAISWIAVFNNTFSIYQVRGGPETRDFRFEPYYRLLATGRTVDPANYDLVYTAPLRDIDTLESIYQRFNIDHPADFKGHSLSVSDVVVLRHGDRQEAHYCDDVGFQEVLEFLRENPLRTAELSTEQSENMIDGIINNTSSPGETAAKEKADKAKKPRKATSKRPSIRAQLKAAKAGQQQKPPTKEKSQDLEV